MNFNAMASSGLLMMQTPPPRPQFSGRGIHPILFLEDLEKYCKRMNISETDLGAVMDCLIGHAKNWSSLHFEQWKNISDFKKSFIEQFWGKEVQNRIKKKINYGKWSPNCNRTVSEYFIELYCEAKRLSSYSSKEAITDDIMFHYPP